MFKLELMLQTIVLKEYALTDGAAMTIGRQFDNDVVLDDKAVSRYHATIEVKNRKLNVFDNGSKNGTIVNKARVKSAQLCHGDIIRIGKNYILRVSVAPEKKKDATITGVRDLEAGVLKVSD
jgi:pSer/pThr/pTyr-binding forkhead associated (FHA) protein